MFAELRPHVRCLGWAFLLAWVFCVFYSGSMDGLASTIEQQTGGGPTELMLNVLPVGSAVATLIIAVAAEKRLGPPTSSRKIIVGAPLVAAAATPVLLVPAPDALLSSLLFVAAAAQPTDYAAAPARPAPFAEAAANMGHVGFGILAACLFVSVEGSFWISEGSDALPRRAFSWPARCSCWPSASRQPPARAACRWGSPTDGCAR